METLGGAPRAAGGEKEAAGEEIKRPDICQGKNSAGENQCDWMTPLGVCFHCPPPF